MQLRNRAIVFLAGCAVGACLATVAALDAQTTRSTTPVRPQTEAPKPANPAVLNSQPLDTRVFKLERELSKLQAEVKLFEAEYKKHYHKLHVGLIGSQTVKGSSSDIPLISGNYPPTNYNVTGPPM